MTNDNDSIQINTGHFTLSRVIALINPTFSVSTISTNFVCIYIQSAYSFDLADARDIRDIPSLGNQQLYYLMTSIQQWN